MGALPFVHVDVFAARPYGGNSLPVFLDAGDLSAPQMQAITRELRHFEAVFLTPTDRADVHEARVFDLLDELPFAGHPLLGAAAALHEATPGTRRRRWEFILASRRVTVATDRTDNGWRATMDQGRATILGEAENCAEIAAAFGLHPQDLDPGLPIEVMSTGLAYLIVPVTGNALRRARPRKDITGLVDAAGAQFAVLLDDTGPEIRHWNNDGLLEDVATGSAAGVIGAYRLRHGRARSGERCVLHQGRFTGRPSRIDVEARGGADEIAAVKVGGEVSLVGRGDILRPPA